MPSGSSARDRCNRLAQAQTPSNWESQATSAKVMCSTSRPVASEASLTMAAAPSKAVTR